MRRSLIVTFTGLDRPGIVDLIARTVADAGGNWEESRMTHLAGHFAGVLHASAPVGTAGELVLALEDLSRDGLNVRVQSGAPGSDVSAFERLRLEITGAERPGIVRDVTRGLVALGINILDLRTEVLLAPMGGGELFRAALRIACPAGVSVEQVTDALEQLGDDITVDLEPEK